MSNKDLKNTEVINDTLDSAEDHNDDAKHNNKEDQSVGKDNISNKMIFDKPYQTLIFKVFLKRFSISFVFCVLVIGGWIYSNYYYTNISDAIEDLSEDIKIGTIRFNKFNEQRKHYKGLLKLWKVMNSSDHYIGDINIENLDNILQDLRMDYKIIKMDTNISVPTESDLFKLKKYDINHIDIQLFIDAISDDHAVSFIYSLMSQMQGYVELRSLELKKRQDITEDSIEKIGQGEFVTSVSCDALIRLYKLSEK